MPGWSIPGLNGTIAGGFPAGWTRCSVTVFWFTGWTRGIDFLTTGGCTRLVKVTRFATERGEYEIFGGLKYELGLICDGIETRFGGVIGFGGAAAGSFTKSITGAVGFFGTFSGGIFSGSLRSIISSIFGVEDGGVDGTVGGVELGVDFSGVRLRILSRGKSSWSSSGGRIWKTANYFSSAHDSGQGLTFLHTMFRSSWSPWNSVNERRTTFPKKHFQTSKTNPQCSDMLIFAVSVIVNYKIKSSSLFKFHGLQDDLKIV